MRLCGGKRGAGVGSFDHIVPSPFQRTPQQATDGGFIVDDEDMRHAASCCTGRSLSVGQISSNFAPCSERASYYNSLRKTYTDSKSGSARSVGSIPTARTIFVNRKQRFRFGWKEIAVSA